MHQKYRLLLSLLLLLSVSFSAYAQEKQADGLKKNYIEKVVMVRISPEAIGPIRNIFRDIHPDSRKNIDQLQSLDAKSISSALGLPLTIHPIALQPYISRHSIAFEAFREQTLPQLFEHQQAIAGPGPSNELKNAEDKVSRWFMLRYSDALEPSQVVTILKRSQAIELAEPRYIRTPCFTPNDSLFSKQYAPQIMHAPEAWDIVRCDSTMLVADVDVGTDWTHEDLNPSIFINQGEVGLDSNGMDKRSNGVDDDGNGYVDDWHGWDFEGADGISPDNDARPGLFGSNGDIDHGTHTAGILDAAGNNRIGICGIAFGARLLPIKASNDDGGSLDFGFQGVVYAADMHAKVINCSWGGTARSDAEQDIINFVTAEGSAVIGAAGNHGRNENYYPASYRHVLSVGASDSSGAIAYFSNFGRYIAVIGPGNGIISCKLGTYGYLNGTSMACPAVAGAVALVRQKYPALTPDQAMQQVRATCDTVQIPQPSMFGYTGRGNVNIYRAVTETSAHSARIISTDLIGAHGNGTFEPGENGSVVLHVQNYLAPLVSLQAKLEIVEGDTAIAHFTTPLLFGKAATLETIANAPNTFLISIAPKVAPNTIVTFRVTFFDAQVGYTDDIDYFSFVVNPAYQDLNKNNITVTLSSKGSMGYNDVLENTQGSGFLWKNPPPQIQLDGRSVLYQGGLMLGLDSTRVVDVVQSDNQFSAQTDFAPFDIIHYVNPPDRAGALQELETAYSDSVAMPYNQIGINVKQRAYEFGGRYGANTVVLQYAFSKNGNTDLAHITDSLSAGLFMDWDIGLSGANNIVRYDSLTKTSYMRRIDPDYPFIGMRVLDKPKESSVQFHAIRNDGTQGDINTYDGFSKIEKWISLSEFYPTTGPGDVAETFGLKNLPIKSQDTVVMTIIMGLGTSAANVDSALNEVKTLWLGPAKVSPLYRKSESLSVFPNPFHDKLAIEWPSFSDNSGKTEIRFYDMLGRVVYITSITSGNMISLRDLQLSPGLYSLQITQSGKMKTEKVLCIR